MAEEKKYPRTAVNLFILNNDGDWFLKRLKKFGNKFNPLSVLIEYGETADEAITRAARAIDLKIDNIEFIGYGEENDSGLDFSGEKKHLIFLNFIGRAMSNDHLKLADKASAYQWLKPADWLKEPDLPSAVGKIIKNHLFDAETIADKYKRALADYQNLLKRTAREKEEFAKYANEQLLNEVLPVFSNLKISLRHGGDEAEKNGWLEGVKLIVKQFQEVLSAQGVEEIRTDGEKFDPASMEALDGQGEKVVQEVMPGYKLRGKVIQPAKVILESINK